MNPLENTKKKYRKKTNKKEQAKETLVVRDILKEETVAFLDTEFLTSQRKGGAPSKLVSIGFVICRKDFKEVDRFHSYIYMDDELHNRFREVTGITEEDLLNAPEYEMVMEEAAQRMAIWNVTRIFVWGPDQTVIQRDLQAYRGDISKRARKSVNRMIRMIKDIESIYSKKLKIHNIGIANLKLLCGLGSEVSHDALDDSIDLKEVVRYLDTKGCPDYMVQAMKTYLSDKELYCRYRRFHEKWDEVPGNLLEKSKELLLELEKINSMEAKALRDDIHVICTGKDTIFPTPEEYLEQELL